MNTVEFNLADHVPVDQYGQFDVKRLTAYRLMNTTIDIFLYARNGDLRSDLNIHACPNPRSVSLFASSKSYADSYARMACDLKLMVGKPAVCGQLTAPELWELAKELRPHVPPHLTSSGFWDGHVI